MHEAEIKRQRITLVDIGAPSRSQAGAPTSNVPQTADEKEANYHEERDAWLALFALMDRKLTESLQKQKVLEDKLNQALTSRGSTEAPWCQ